MLPPKNKKRALILLFGVIVSFLFSEKVLAQGYWMEKAGSTTNDEASGISIDANDNTYTTGYFTGTASFGGFNVTAAGVSDVFVAKTNSAGVYQWVQKGGDGGSDRGLAIKTDAKGNSYVTGFFYATATFGAFNATSAGAQDVFVVKYDKNGNVKWLVKGGGSQSDIGNSINIDNSGNVVITGEFAGSATFGGFVLNSVANNVNVFTAKLDSANGNFIWAKSGVGPHTDRGLGVACDASNNVYVTGEYTDTITFGITHFSPLVDGIFLIKYDANGNEKWFTTAGGGSYNIANSIFVDRSSNVYLTGDFTGTLKFYVNPLVTLSNVYTNKIFIAKYDNNANLLWATADGSSGSLTSRSIAVDSLGNAYILGNFECLLNGYADRYGQGTFNTVGYWDIFGAEYSSAGVWQWSRQIGGRKNNYGNGIMVDSKGAIFTAGSFDQDMICTSNPANFLGYSVSNINTCNTNYCSDPNYGDFASFTTRGNLDIYIAKPFDLSRQTYDFYNRSGNICDRPQVGVCVNPNCQDSVEFCSGGTVFANSNTCSQVGPAYNYVWGNLQVGGGIFANVTGWYTVTETSADGCFVSKDSIYVTIHPAPTKPNISDNVVINTNAVNPLPIEVCADSIKLTGGGFGNSTYNWSNGSTATTANIEVKKDGIYCFNVKDANGCTNQTCVQVTLDSAFKPIKPKIKCENCSHDTAFLCKGSSFTLFPYDSISNPFANLALCIPPKDFVFNDWRAYPDTINYARVTLCPDQNSFQPVDSGWFHIVDSIVLKNLCDTVKYLIKDSIFVRLYPQPKLGPVSITGTAQICPGDSSWLVAHDTAHFTWSTGSTNDSIHVPPGSYTITSSRTNSHGCTTTVSAFFIVSYKVPPTIIVTAPNNGVICPGDSLKLTCTGGSGTFQWMGPSGPVGGNSSTIYVTAPGGYYCIVSNPNYCAPVLSNTVVLNLYTVPYLTFPSTTIICPGDTATVVVNTSAGSLIHWDAPLNNSDSVEHITKGGTYTCEITSCGITTKATVTVNMSNPTADITASGPKVICVGDSVTLTGNNGMSAYSWTPGNVNSQSITVKKTGIYTLVTTDSNGCKAKDTTKVTVNINHLTKPTVKDTSVCPGSLIVLNAEGPGLTWYDSASGGAPLAGGSQYFTPGINGPTTYYVQSSAYGCISQRMPVVIDVIDCSGVYIPNIFTPNGDGRDDIWYVTILGARCFQCTIYDRWGVIMYQSTDIHNGWNGLVQQSGKMASDGVYYYIIDFCNYQNIPDKRDGFLQLIRGK